MKSFPRPTIDAAALKEYQKVVGVDEEATVKSFIDTGFADLNEIMTGRPDAGLPQGRIVEMYGPSQAGKTALASDWMAMTQRMGGCAGFVDWERSFSSDVAVRGYGVDLTAPYWTYKKPNTFEEGCDQAMEYAQWVRDRGVIHEEAPILIVLDSLAAAVPHSVMYKAKVKETAPEAERLRSMADFNMRDQLALALATSHVFPKMSVYAEKYNTTFMFLNQIRTDPTVMFGDPLKTPGGKSPEFYATVRLSLGRTKIKDADKETTGQDIKIKCSKSKLTQQDRETTMRLAYDPVTKTMRFDKELSLVELLVERKKIAVPKNGYVTWDGKQKSKREFADIIRDQHLTDQMNALLFPVMA